MNYIFNGMIINLDDEYIKLFKKVLITMVCQPEIIGNQLFLKNR
ncbi:MAG: hypothetical protein ACSHXG_13110 [Maribacter stanieri]